MGSACPGASRITPLLRPPLVITKSLISASPRVSFFVRLFPTTNPPGHCNRDPRRSLQRSTAPLRFRGTHPRHTHPQPRLPHSLGLSSGPFHACLLTNNLGRRILTHYICARFTVFEVGRPFLTAARLHELLLAPLHNISAYETPATMVRGALSTAFAAAALVGSAFAGAKCTKDSHCPADTPCCSRAYHLTLAAKVRC